MIFWGVVVEEEGEEVITRNRMLTRANASGKKKTKEGMLEKHVPCV